MNQITDTVKHLIIINVIFYLATQFLGEHIFEFLALWFPINPKFGIWQIVTHMFTHSMSFFFHILFNMLALWMFGSPLERIWGQQKFLFFYFSAGIGAVILPFIIDYYQLNGIITELTSLGQTKEFIINTIKKGEYYPVWETTLGNEKFTNLLRIIGGSTVGASGAVMGLLAAFGIYYPNAKLAMIFLPIPIAAKYFIPALLGYELLSGVFQWPSLFGVNVAHFAHLGGAIIGGIIAWYWKKNQFRIQ